MLTLTSPTVFDATHFARFTLPELRDALAACSAWPGFVAVGALWGNQPVGMALGQVRLNNCGALLSLSVDGPFRRRGIGTALVRDFEAALRDRECTRVEAQYVLGTTGTYRFERTLQRCGWPVSGGRRHSFALDGKILSAPWFRNATLPLDYHIAPWQTVTPDERRMLTEAHASNPWVPEHLQPHLFESPLDEATSLVLRRAGTIIGWTLTSAVDEGTVHYRNVYVRPSCNRVGKTFAALALIAEAVRRQAAARGVRSRGLFDVSADNRAFLRFIGRHLAADVLSARVVQRVVKTL